MGPFYDGPGKVGTWRREQRSARHVRRWGVVSLVLVALVILLAGCATSAPPLKRQMPTDPRADAALAEIPRDAAFERARCPKEGVRVHVDTIAPGAQIMLSTCEIGVHPGLLDAPDMLRAIIGHELGHLYNRDASSARARVPQIEKENQADAWAAERLSRIGLEACLGLSRVLQYSQDTGTGTHPNGALRVRQTASLCYQHAEAKDPGFTQRRCAELRQRLAVEEEKRRQSSAPVPYSQGGPVDPRVPILSEIIEAACPPAST